MMLSQSRSRLVAWSIWIVVSVFYAYQYILRVMPNILLNDIMQQFQVGAGAFGQFSGVYYIGYSLMHLPLGIMLDRFGPKKVIPASILLSVVGLVPLIYTTQWSFPIMGRILVGMGSSAAILGVFKIIRMAFTEKNFSKMLSFSVTIGLIGAIYGGGPVSFMRESLGYERVVQIFALMGIILAVGAYLVLPNIKTSGDTTVLSDMKEVLMNKRVIFSCIFAGLMVGPLEGFADVWGKAFLKQVYGFDGTMAASLPSLIFIGMCFGGPILSFVAEKVGNYLVAIMLSGIVMAASFYVLLDFKMNSAMLTIALVLIGICSAYQILAIYKVSTYVREQVAGLTTALANMIIMIFGYAFHATMGSVINMLGGPSVSRALIYGVSVIPIALILGFAGYGCLLIQEKKTKALKVES